jgi:hypothetical protein
MEKPIMVSAFPSEELQMNKTPRRFFLAARFYPEDLRDAAW